MDLIFIDTETTGIANCRLIELAWAKEGEAISVIRVKPPVPIEEQALAVHGITEEALKDCPAFEAHPAYTMLKDLFAANIVVMHNAEFDRGVLEREGIQTPNYLCTKWISRRLYPSLMSHRLQELRDQFCFNIEADAHSAGGDVAVLVELFKKMLGDMEADGLMRENAITQMARFSIH